MSTRTVSYLRLIAGLAFLAFAAWEARLIFLFPALILFYQYYRDLNCVVCDAGFCGGDAER